MKPGQHIGQYKIVRPLGKGGMGEVFLAEHVLLGRRAAVKTLLPALSAQPAIVERFFNEARATAQIGDPGVVQVFDFGYHVDGTAYIVMELLEGEPLCDRLARVGVLPAVQALTIGRQVAGALAAAHAANIIHRDLKPENVFVVEMPDGERAKLLDFGICKLLEGKDVRMTESGVVLGTPVYMSPEQCRCAEQIDGRADIYALGGLLFHMLTGRPPYTLETGPELMVAHLTADVPRPSDVIDCIAEEIDAIVMKCMAKEPDDRYATMHEVQQALDEVIGQMGTAPMDVVMPKVRSYTPGGARVAESGDVQRRSSGSLHRSASGSGRGSPTPVERPHAVHVTASPLLMTSQRAAWRRVGKLVAGAIVLGAAGLVGLGAYAITSDQVTKPAPAAAVAAPVAAPPVAMTSATAASDPLDLPEAEVILPDAIAGAGVAVAGEPLARTAHTSERPRTAVRRQARPPVQQTKVDKPAEPARSSHTPPPEDLYDTR